MDGPVRGCPKQMGGLRHGVQCRQMGPGRMGNADGWPVSKGDGWAGAWLSKADGWAEAWCAMRTDGLVAGGPMEMDGPRKDGQCRRMGR